MGRVRVVCVLAAFAAVAALAGRTTAHDDDFDNDGIPDVAHAVDLGIESSNVYFVDTGVAWHHNPWRCRYTTGCDWPHDYSDPNHGTPLPRYIAVGGQQEKTWPYWDERPHHSRTDWGKWAEDSYVVEIPPDQEEFASPYVLVTNCWLHDDGVHDLDCEQAPPSSAWEWVGRIGPRWPTADSWTEGIHDNDRTVMAAVCLSDSELAAAKAALSPDDYKPIDDLKGWHTNRTELREAFGRGWTDQGETPRIAVYDKDRLDDMERLLGGTALFLWLDGHDQGPWVFAPHEFFLDRDDADEPILSPAMSAEDLGSCWSDPVVVDDSVPWMAATVCQRASDFNLRVGNTDTYPWVDATGKPWYRALDHRSTAEATGLYRPLDWALLGFEEWEPLADAAVAAGLVWAVWPDDPDDPAYDSTGRSFADYGGKPVCILPNG